MSVVGLAELGCYLTGDDDSATGPYGRPFHGSLDPRKHFYGPPAVNMHRSLAHRGGKRLKRMALLTLGSQYAAVRASQLPAARSAISASRTSAPTEWAHVNQRSDQRCRPCRPDGVAARAPAEQPALPVVPAAAGYRHFISNVHVLSPWHWHFVSVTDGSVPPCRRIDSWKYPNALAQKMGLYTG